MARPNIIGPVLSIAVVAVIIYLIYSNTRQTHSEKSLKISVAEAKERNGNNNKDSCTETS